MNKHNMQLLQEAATLYGPLCVGLDTDPSYIPQNIRSGFKSDWQAVLEYNKRLIEQITKEKLACCFKIQVAYYEAMGLEGMQVYSQTLKEVKKAGLIAISDIKRGDIGATSDAYAKAHFTGDFETDIITINPYMGFDTLQPFTKYAEEDKGGKAAFVLLCTSNPGMVDIEHQRLQDGTLLLEKVGDEIARIGNEFSDLYKNQTCGIFGAVVGATQERDARYLREKYKDTLFLIPGYGMQGGSAKVASVLLEKAGGVVNSSRAILCAWKTDENLSIKLQQNILTMDDIVDAAVRKADFSKKELLGLK